jgi:hypothetical protein
MGRQVTVFMPIVRVSPAHKHTDDAAFGGAKARRIPTLLSRRYDSPMR